MTVCLNVYMCTSQVTAAASRAHSAHTHSEQQGKEMALTVLSLRSDIRHLQERAEEVCACPVLARMIECHIALMPCVSVALSKHLMPQFSQFRCIPAR